MRVFFQVDTLEIIGKGSNGLVQPVGNGRIVLTVHQAFSGDDSDIIVGKHAKDVFIDMKYFHDSSSCSRNVFSFTTGIVS